MDCAPECWEFSLFIGKGSWLQLYSWSQVFGSKASVNFFLNCFLSSFKKFPTNEWYMYYYVSVMFI